MPQPIINDILPLTQITAGSSQTVFSTNWTANAATDVVVYNTPFGQPANDVTQFVNPSLYTVQFIGQLQTVQVTFNTAPAQNNTITITRMTPVSRQNLYTNTNFTPSMLNQDFEVVTLETQENELVNQQVAPRYNYSAVVTPVVDTILPILGANQFWAKNAANNAIVALDISAIIGGGTVTSVGTGTGLTGGPITTSGTISFAAIPANTFWANITGGSAVPTTVSTGYFLQTANNLSDIPNAATARTNLGLAIGTNVEAWSAKLDSLAGLSFVQNDLLYVTSATTLGLIAAANNSVLVTANNGIPSLSQTLPQAVQTNIQYLGAQNQNLNMGGHQINNGADPTQPSDFATKNYVDLNSLTSTAVYAVTAASLGTVTQSGAGVGATLTNAGTQATLAVDGVNPPVGSNILVNITATGMTAANQGIYTVTNAGSGASNWVLTRATTYDTPTEINNTGLIVAQNGATLAGTAWYNAAKIVTVDTTSFNYSQFGNIVFPVSLAHGGTNANLTAAAGGVVYSGATALAISAVGSAGQLFQSAGASAPGWTTATFPSTATNAGTILRADGTNWVATTATYPATTTINQLLYSSAANVISGLATGNSGVLVTSAGGVPSISSTLPAGLIASTMQIGTILDSNAVNILSFTATASAVNYVTIQNNITGGPAIVAAAGSDTDIALSLQGKGNRGTQTQTPTNGSSPGIGFRGYHTETAIGSATLAVSNTPQNIQSLSLAAGCWEIRANPFLQGGASNNVNVVCLSTTSATLNGALGNTYYSEWSSGIQTFISLPLYLRLDLAATTTVYLVAQGTFTGTGPVISGQISATQV